MTDNKQTAPPTPPPAPQSSARMRILDLHDGERYVVFDKVKGDRGALGVDAVKKETGAAAVLTFPGVIDLDDC